MLVIWVENVGGGMQKNGYFINIQFKKKNNKVFRIYFNSSQLYMDQPKRNVT